MAEGARIYSTEAIKSFRAAMIKFAEASSSAMTSADSDIDRVIGWLERDQTTFWAMQVRKRHEIVLKWEDAVRQKRLYKNVDGTTQSAVDEMKKLQQAKRAEDEAHQKVASVKKSLMVLRKEAMMYKGRVQRLATALSSDLPKAVRTIDVMLDHVANYLQVQTTGEGINIGESADSIIKIAAAERVGLEKLRDLTPPADRREAAPLQMISGDHPIFQPWAMTGGMQDWQTKALNELTVDRLIPDPDHRIVMHPDTFKAQKLVFERRDPTSEADSGWYLGPADAAEPKPDVEVAYQAFRAGDVCSARPDFRDLLNLPLGTLIILDAGGPSAIFDQLGLDIWSLALIKSAEPADGGAPKDGAASPDTAGTADSAAAAG